MFPTMQTLSGFLYFAKILHSFATSNSKPEKFCCFSLCLSSDRKFRRGMHTVHIPALRIRIGSDPPHFARSGSAGSGNYDFPPVVKLGIGSASGLASF
jgi:hypothetical protein